jgi:hypothetical protein
VPAFPLILLITMDVVSDFSRVDADLHYFLKLDPNPDVQKSEKLDPDPH